MQPSSQFRIQGKGFFLTYPQCAATREELAQALKGKAPVEKLIVAREEHKDGEAHLHAFVKYSKTLNIRQPNFFDFLGYHGNYQTAKSFMAVQKYILKDDKEPLQEGMDAQQEVEARTQHRRVLGKRLLTESLEEVKKDHPELLFGYKKLKQDIEEWKRDQAREDKQVCEGLIPNTFEKLMPIKDCKQRHYWCWSSEPNKGKTTWLKELDDLYRCSWYSFNENFQEIYKDTQFLLFDEFTTAHLKSTQLNQMCDGTYQYPSKGGSSVTIKPILLVCGNRHPQEIYPNCWPFINARFNVIDL